jgi:hypothetical protein
MDRRFLNLVMHDLRNNTRSLHRMDLRHLFYKTPEIAEQAAREARPKKNKLRALPPLIGLLRKAPVISSRTSNFFALPRESRESTVLMADSSGHTAILDIYFNSVVTTEPMDYGKGPNCVCFDTPDPHPFMDGLDSPRCFFVLDLVPGTDSSSFEVLEHFGSDLPSRPLVSSHHNWNWNWSTLLVPPFLDDPAYRVDTKIKTCSSMLLGESTICVSSMQEGIGTYTFDMSDRLSRTPVWSRTGSWVLPFCGKAEYVPGHKLWIALSTAGTPHGLCALDLPAMNFDSPPELQRTWGYLDLPDTPYRRLLVNLGSGKFCVISFFRTSTFNDVKEIIQDECAVFTSLEVHRCNSADGSVRMIKHMSKRYSFQKYAIYSVI